ncbi:MAG: hypothetical protein J6Y54_09750, partial [Lentisphaeria bacterium]|nr:hypothetical protein [Lentisphaeria bacterium]
MSGFFDLMAANAVSVRAPISGQTGVWVYNSKTLVSSAMKMSGVVVSGRNNSMTVLSKGKSYDTIVRASASMKVNAGGVANSTIVSAGGYLYVSSGGVVDVVSAGNASITILSGGTATNIAAANGGHLNITVAPDTYIQGTRAGSAFEMKNAMISGYTISNGGMHVSSGGTANETTVAYQCYLRVSNGGVANSTIVSSSGDMNVYSGGTALETEWRPGCGTLDVDIEGVATVKLSGVYFCGESRATIDNTSSAMYLSGFSDSHVWVFSGGTASDCAVESVCFGGYAENCSTPIRENNGRNTYVYSGGVVNSFYANYYLANLYIRGAASNVSSFRGPTSVFVFSGGSLDGVIVGNGNYLYVSSGGTAVGILESGGIVVLKEGGAATFVPCIISGGTLGFRDALLGATIHSKTIATSCAVIG